MRTNFDRKGGAASNDAGPAEAASGGPRTLQIGRWRFSYSPFVFLASLTASLFFLIFGPYTNFSQPGYLDPWIYTGAFSHFSWDAKHYGFTYYVSRLPWILPGAAVFQIANPETATIILNALIMAGGAAALFLIVDTCYGLFPALLASIALVTNPYFVSTISWDYPDGPAIAYAFLAIAAFLRTRSGRIPNALIGGACLALSGYTNFAVLPVLLGIVSIPLWRYRRSLKKLMMEGIYIFLGGTLTTLVLAVFSKIFLNYYLFFMPQVNMILYTRAHPDYLSNMWGTGNGWIPIAYRLFPPLLLLFLGAVRWLRKRIVKPLYVETYLALAVSCVLYCIFEFGLHNVSLRVHYLSGYLVAVMFPFAGALIGEFLAPGPEVRTPRLVHGAAWGILTCAFGAALPFLWSRAIPFQFPRPGFWWDMLILAGAAAAAALAFPRWRVAGLALCCLLFVGLFVGPAYDGSIAFVWVKNNAIEFRMLMQLEKSVDSALDARRVARFWVDADEPARRLPQGLTLTPVYFFDSAASLYIDGVEEIGKRLKSEPIDNLRGIINRDTTLVHVSFEGDKTPERTALLVSHGIVAGNERRWVIPTDSGNLYVTLQDVIDDSHIH